MEKLPACLSYIITVICVTLFSVDNSVHGASDTDEYFCDCHKPIVWCRNRQGISYYDLKFDASFNVIFCTLLTNSA